MQDASGSLNIGVVLLSSDFRVVGMNPYAQKILGSTISELGQSIFAYHNKSIHPKIDLLLKQCCSSGAYMPVAMIIDVLNKFLLVHLSRVNMHESYGETIFSMTFIDVTEQTGAKRHPQSQLTQIDRFPVFFGNSYQILETPSIYFIQSDGNYCIVHTEQRTYHLLMTLKSILDRYAGTNFVMVHKSYLVNLDHVHGMQRLQNRTMVIFDSDRVPVVPVARRRIKTLKAALGIDDRSSFPVDRLSKNC
jgi:hypothetical protein